MSTISLKAPATAPDHLGYSQPSQDSSGASRHSHCAAHKRQASPRQAPTTGPTAHIAPHRQVQYAGLSQVNAHFSPITGPERDTLFPERHNHPRSPPPDPKPILYRSPFSHIRNTRNKLACSNDFEIFPPLPAFSKIARAVGAG